MSLFVRDNGKEHHLPCPLAPAKVIYPSMTTMDQKNITTLMRSTGQLFKDATRHLTPDVTKHKNEETKSIISVRKVNVSCRNGFNATFAAIKTNRNTQTVIVL
jgi:hypothetical protein